MRLPGHLHGEDKKPVVTVHWESVPMKRIACLPNFKEEDWHGRGVPCLRSDDPLAVTCPNCLKTQELQAAIREQEGA